MKQRNRGQARRRIGAFRRLVALAALAAVLCPGLARAQTIRPTAGISPPRPQPGQAFQLTVHVLEWPAGGCGTPQGQVAATIAWPDWRQLGLTVTQAPASSVRPSSVAGQPAVATSLTVGLQAAAAGVVTVPPLRVQGATGSAMTEPLLVVIEANAAPVSQVPPARPPSTVGLASGPAALAQEPQPQPPTTPGDDRLGRLQMALGAAAFYAVVAAVVAMLVVKSRRRRR
jgi:hypothetical protein